MHTLECSNRACNQISKIAWECRTFRQYDLHKLLYAQIRQQTGLTAQVVVRCIAKVADAYKLDRDTPRIFKSHGALAYDDRILHWYTEHGFVSIWTTAGRMKIGYKAGERQLHQLQFRQGETDLIYRKGKFFLAATCEIPAPEPVEFEAVLGVDLGIINLTTDSDGNTYSGKKVDRARKHYSNLRARLQKRGTKSAKRKLKRLSGKQRRFQKDTNHGISKRIVATAECTNRAIAVEKLTGIRSRTKVRGKEQRHRHTNWSFYQLKQFMAYKAALAGVTLIEVDPKFTSQRCYECGHIAKANRRSQSEFVCCVAVILTWRIEMLR